MYPKTITECQREPPGFPQVQVIIIHVVFSLIYQVCMWASNADIIQNRLSYKSTQIIERLKSPESNYCLVDFRPLVQYVILRKHWRQLIKEDLLCSNRSKNGLL